MSSPRAVALVLCLAAVTPGAARAQGSDIDTARAAYADADFAGALEALARAEAAEGLDRAQVIDLLVTRAMVHFATGSLEAMRADLGRLLTLEASPPLPAETPPSVLRALEELRAEIPTLAFEESVQRTDDGAQYRARLSGSPRGLERGRRARCRWDDGDAEGRDVVSLDAASGETVLCYAQLIGPGGAILLASGDDEAPNAFTMPTAPVAGDDSVGWIVAGTLIASALVAAAVVVGVFFATQPPQTVLEWPPL